MTVAPIEVTYINPHRIEPVEREEPARRTFTAAEFKKMAETGLLRPHERVELLDGEIIKIPAIGNRHAQSVIAFTTAFREYPTELFVLSVQGPLALSNKSMPVPDLVLLARGDGGYAGGIPEKASALLVVEVSDSTLWYDRNRRLPRYAEEGVPEVWIANLRHEVIEAYLEPHDGAYRVQTTYRRGESIVVAALPSVTVLVDDVIPLPVVRARRPARRS